MGSNNSNILFVRGPQIRKTAPKTPIHPDEIKLIREVRKGGRTHPTNVNVVTTAH